MRLSKQNKVIVVIVSLVLTLVVGYALFSESINVGGTASASGDFAIIFDKVGTITQSGSKGSTAEISTDKKRLNITIPGLEYPGSYVEVPVTIKNTGSIKAKVTGISTNGLTNNDITVSYSGVTKDEVMSPNDTKDMKVRVTWNKSSTSTSSSLSFTIEINYEQDMSEIEANTPVVPNDNLNTPSLTDNMVPVVYDAGNWKVADTSKEWYNYDKKMWANAIVLTDKSHPAAGTIITESKIDSMLVWIPRYEYQIPADVGKGKEKEIPVNFTKSTTPSAGYTIHPAFKFGEQELSGIWVGKFETSGTTSNITIKPNVQSLRSVDLYNFFTSIYNTQSKLVGTTDRTKFDTHMMKNLEWGCAAYLSHSKYGIDKEIAINNSSIFTGRSGGAVSGKVNTVKTQFPSEISNDSQAFIHGYYTYDGKVVNYDGSIGPMADGIKGMDASTTGNIYGIYDMSGGAWEYVMAFMKTQDGAGLTYQSSGFTDANKPASKYYDEYDYGTSHITYERGHIGDATKELNPISNPATTWYDDRASLVYFVYSFALRGGSCFDGSRAGAFNFGYDTGDANSAHTSRLVITR